VSCSENEPPMWSEYGAPVTCVLAYTTLERLHVPPARGARIEVHERANRAKELQLRVLILRFMSGARYRHCRSEATDAE